MADQEGHFTFAIHRPASKGWLEADVLRVHRGALRRALMRPGLMTYKSERDLVGEAGPLGSPFARVWGRSLGVAREAEEVVAIAQRILGSVGPPLVLHAFARLGDDPAPTAEAVEAVRALECEVRAAAPSLFAPHLLPASGDRVLDVVVAPGEPAFVGIHRHDDARWRVPGGAPAIELPTEAPSRAYSKFEEALVWSGLCPRVGEYAIDLGSAPGGATFALVERGVSVLAVDPAAMAESVLARTGPGGARIVHIRFPVSALVRRDLPPRVEWILSDMNLAPPVVLRYLTRIVPWARPHLRAMVLTLKLNDERMVRALPEAMEQIAAFGLPFVRATQLPSNRNEVCVVAHR